MQEWARELGFSQIGVAGVDLSAAEPGLAAWLAQGFHGDMHYMASHGMKRARPAELVPGTVSVITARMDYLPLELAGVSGARAEATAWLERVGLGHRLRHYPKHLSGGEQQRVALARAFAPAPQLVLADEPTGNLDAATGHQIIELMFAINAERGTTLILVTHDEEIAARCARRLRMHAGRIEEAPA